MAKQPSRAELVAALIDMFDQIQQLRFFMSYYGNTLIEDHNRRVLANEKKLLTLQERIDMTKKQKKK